MELSPEKMPVHRVPRRFFVGGVLAGGVMAGLVWMGQVGAIHAPSSVSFRFSRGVSFAPGEEARLRALISELAAEPRIQFRITGHTGTNGAAGANLALSEARAEATREVLEALGIPSDRVQFVGGLGGTEPLPKLADEGGREHERRLARVTVSSFVQP